MRGGVAAIFEKLAASTPPREGGVGRLPASQGVHALGVLPLFEGEGDEKLTYELDI